MNVFGDVHGDLVVGNSYVCGVCAEKPISAEALTRREIQLADVRAELRRDFLLHPSTKAFLCCWAAYLLMIGAAWLYPPSADFAVLYSMWGFVVVLPAAALAVRRRGPLYAALRKCKRDTLDNRSAIAYAGAERRVAERRRNR